MDLLCSPFNWNWWVLWRFYLHKYTKQYNFSSGKFESSPVLYNSYTSKGDGIKFQKLQCRLVPGANFWIILVCSEVCKKYIVVYVCAQVMHIHLHLQAHLDVVQGPLSSMGIFPLLHRASDQALRGLVDFKYPFSKVVSDLPHWPRSAPLPQFPFRNPSLRKAVLGDFSVPPFLPPSLRLSYQSTTCIKKINVT